MKAAERVGPGGLVCGRSCFDITLGGLHSEVWETQKFERVGVPLGEQVVHFRVVFVIGRTVVVRYADASRRARTFDASRPPLCTMTEWRGGTTLPLEATAFSVASRPVARAPFTHHCWAMALLNQFGNQEAAEVEIAGGDAGEIRSASYGVSLGQGMHPPA